MDKNDLYFKRGNNDIVSYTDMIKIIADFITASPASKYQFTVGSDSQTADHTKMVEAVVIHRIGDGGIFFYRIEHIKTISNLKQKITTETSRSLELTDGIVDDLELVLMENDIDINDLDLNFQIHCDIGHNGKTKALITEIVSWVTSCGYDCAIKPESYCASSIANKFSKF